MPVKSTPRVSIIIPLFNREGLIVQTLDSIASQIHESFEAIVVDDQSTDQGPEKVRNFARCDHRFKLVLRETEKGGAPVCRNFGLDRSAGEFIIFLDSDDLLAPRCIEQRLASFMAEPQYDLVVSQGLIFSCSPGDHRTLWNCCDYDPDHVVERFLNQDMPWANGGPMWRRKAIEKIGAWNTDLRCFQDWELHLRACIEGLRINVQPKPDFFIRRSESADQISSSHNTLHHVESRIHAFELVVRLLESKQQLIGSVKNSARGFLLRNHLSLHDAGCDEEAMMILRSEFGRKLLNPIDRWLLRWIRKQGESWHWNSRVERVTDFWWQDLQYDALDMDTDFMKAEWSGDIPCPLEQNPSD